MLEQRADWLPVNRTPELNAGGPRTIAVAATVVFVFLMSFGTRDHFGNDSAQYFSVTGNLIAGHGLSTSTVYYESQTKLGFPAAQTIWPPGLPLLAAGAAKLLALQPDVALRLVDGIAHSLTGVLLYWIVWTLRASRPLALGIATGFLLYVPLLRQVLSGISEPIYHLTIIASAACLLKALVASGAHDWRWVAGAAACVSAGVLMRYPAAFQVVPLGLASWYALARHRKPARALRLAAVLCLPVVMVFAALLIRNVALTGFLTGASSGPRPPTMAEMVFDAKWGALGLFGVSHFAFIKWAILALLLALTLGLVSLVRNRSSLRWNLTPGQIGFAIYGIISAIISAGLLLVLASRSIFYSFESRYFVLTALMILLSIIALLPRYKSAIRLLALTPTPGLTGAVLVASAAMLLVAQHIDLFFYKNTASTPQAVMRHALQAHFGGTTIGQHLHREASLKAPVLSNQSQLLHLILDRPTIGVPEYRLTSRVWSADDILAVARGAGANRLVVFTKMPLGMSDGSTDYVWRLANGGHPALTRILTTEDLIVFHIADQV